MIFWERLLLIQPQHDPHPRHLDVRAARDDADPVAAQEGLGAGSARRVRGRAAEHHDRVQRASASSAVGAGGFRGNILGCTGAQSKRQRELSTSLKEKFAFNSACFVNCVLKDGEEWSDEALEKSIACLAVSLEERRGFGCGGQLVSFRYVAAAISLREMEREFVGV